MILFLFFALVRIKGHILFQKIKEDNISAMLKISKINL